jgi:methionyl aminopeptidase
MINAGTHETVLMSDNWTVVTRDGGLSAQWEHTVAVTEEGVDILTIPEHGEPWSLSFQVAERVQ